MKKTIYTFSLLLLFCLFQNNLNAQQNSSDSKMNPINDEFALTVGLGSSAGMFIYSEFLPFYETSYPWFFSSVTPQVTARKSPAFNLAYTVNLNPFIAFTGAVSYTHLRLYYNKTNIINVASISRINLFTFYIGPRFTWHNTKSMKLYSSALIGYGMAYDKTKTYLWNDRKSPLIDFQVTPIGAIFCNRYNVELGFGGTGFLKFGFIFK